MSATVISPAHIPPECIVDFDLYNIEGADKDFHRAWKKLQDPSLPPLLWTPWNGGHWIATRADDIFKIFSDYHVFSAGVALVPKEVNDKLKLLPTKLNPPEHRPYRKLINYSLTPKIVHDLEPHIRQLTISLIDEFYDRGECEFASEFAEILPVGIFLRLADLPMEDRDMLRDIACQITRPDGSMTPEEIFSRFADYLLPKLEERRERPGDDLFSRVVKGDINGKPITDQDALELCSQMLLAGMDTVVSLLGFVMMFLAENPRHRKQLRQNPEILDAAVDEFIRRFPLVSNTRIVAKDTSIKGIAVKAGDIISLPTMLHNLDDDIFPDPLNVDYNRSTKQPHCSFGNGPHRCPGSLLAKTELRIVLEEWLQRIPDFAISEMDKVRILPGIVGTVVSLPLRWTS